MVHRFSSVFTSYTSLILTVLDALTVSPLIFTRPFSHATAEADLVLNRRMAHKYLSNLSFSFSILFAQFSKILVKIWDGFNALVIVYYVIFLIGRM